MSIEKYVINNLKDDSKNDILDMINESVNDNSEEVLPGLGVLLKILWNNVSDNEKDNISNIIYNSINAKK